jgi:hypothetical protein
VKKDEVKNDISMHQFNLPLVDRLDTSFLVTKFWVTGIDCTTSYGQGLDRKGLGLRMTAQMTPSILKVKIMIVYKNNLEF